MIRQLRHMCPNTTWFRQFKGIWWNHLLIFRICFPIHSRLCSQWLYNEMIVIKSYSLTEALEWNQSSHLPKLKSCSKKSLCSSRLRMICFTLCEKWKHSWTHCSAKMAYRLEIGGGLAERPRLGILLIWFS